MPHVVPAIPSVCSPSSSPLLPITAPPGSASKSLGANAIVHLFASDGRHLTALCDNDGAFTLRDVPSGSHLMQAHLMQYYYPEVWGWGEGG